MPHLNTDNDPNKPRWLEESHYTKKTNKAPYGYQLFSGKERVFQSIEGLVADYTLETEPINFFWRPEHDHILLSREIEELYPIFKKKNLIRCSARLKSSRNTALLILLAAALYIFIEMLSGNSIPSFHFILGGIIFTIIGLNPLYQAWSELNEAKTLTPQNLKDGASEIRFNEWLAHQSIIYTKILALILVIFALIQGFSNQGKVEGFIITAFEAGLKAKPTLNGEYWRLLSAPLLHGNLIHLFFNLSALWFIGKRIETLVNWHHLAVAFLISAIAGGYTSIYFLPENTPSIGASGGIMGLIGFQLIMEIFQPNLAPKKAKKTLIMAIVFTAIIGIIGVQFIDNAAHFGGLIAGGVYGLITSKFLYNIKKNKASNMEFSLAALSIVLLVFSILITISKITQYTLINF